MKRLLALLCLLFVFSASATNVLLSLSDARLITAYYSNRVIVLQPMSTPTVSSPSVVLGGQITLTNDANGNLWYSNLFTGLYHVIVLAPPDRQDFAFFVTATNLGNINAADNLVAASTATFPAGSVAWSIAVSDGRYSRNTNQPVSFYMVTNALGYTPQPSAPNLTNWANVTTNSLLTLPYIGNSSGSGTNTILDYANSGNNYSTFIHPYSTTGVELLYQLNDLSSAVMLWRSIGSQLYLNSPIITGGTINGAVTVTGTIVGNGSGLTNLTPQANFQFGSSVLTNLATGNNISANTLLGTDGGKNPVSYAAGNDITVSGGIVSSTAATTATNGLGVAISNYVLTVSQNATNQSLKIGAAATNDDLLFGLNSTNQSLLIGSNATNDDLLFGLGSTNNDLVIGASATNNDNRLAINATNQSLLIGLNATNEALMIGLGATNEALLIGANGTNQSLLIGLNATNEALLIGGNGTNEALLIGANGSNNVLLASNNLNTAKQQGAAVLTNITAATGTPSSSTFLRGDFAWATPSGSGTGWNLTGNSGTTAGANFIGTTDSQYLMMKVFGAQAFLLRGGGSILGGSANSVVGANDSVLCGNANSIGGGTAGTYNLIAGGNGNAIQGTVNGNNTISGGNLNTITSGLNAATIGGGNRNQVQGAYATVPGGSQNIAAANNSFAAGQQANANNQGAFVWADSQNATFASTNNDSFNIRAQGGTILSGPLFAQTNYAGYATLTNPLVSGVKWTNTTSARVEMTIDYTLTSSSGSGFPGLCMTNLTTGEWFNATNSLVLAVVNSGRQTFLMSPNDILLVTNKSSTTATASLDASWAKVQ